MKNPIIITLDNNKHVEIGDPFILRFNGKYYLYCSTCDEEEGIRCFLSDDLVNYTYYGLVATSPILKHAYAPEVIYKDDEFIMATSPRGNGHYFLKSKSPLGPFEFITGNIQNMIDGSFVNDKNNNLHFLRADHNGIAYLDYKNNKLINRKDILPQISNAWTEGPSITYYKDYYYATYCGNNVISDNYRIKISSSKYIDKDYKVMDAPLLLATEKDFYALGHNSVVLGPSLDEYFVCYHKLKRLEKGTTRFLCLDRLYLNKNDASCNYSYFDIVDPLRPYFECDVSVNNKLNRINNFLLTDESTLDKFTVEFNFRKETSLILSYINESNYTLFHLKDNLIEIKDVNNGIESKVYSKTTKFNFNHFHSIRLINDDKLECLIDNIPLFKINKLSKGKLGFMYKENDLYYIAYTNNAYLSSLKEVPVVIPSKVSSLSFEGKFKENVDFKYLVLKRNESSSLKVYSKEKSKYKVYARMKDNNVKIRLSSSLDSSIYEIKSNNCAYEFSNRLIGELEIDKNDTLSIEVLEGKLEFSYLLVNELIDDTFLDKDLLKNKDEFYLFNRYCKEQSLYFRFNLNNDDSLFGLIFNSNDYCDYSGVKNIKYHGYFVGFENNLLVVDYAQYDRVRIYDKPYRLKRNKKYKLSARFLDNKLEVYVNDKLEFVTDLKYDTCYGKTGVYKNKYSKISILDYKEGI